MPLSELLAGWTAEPVRPGIALSGATVERWTKPGEPDRFLKSAAPTWDRGLDAEAARLRWLATTGLARRVATVLFHGITEDGVERLLTTAVGGRDGAALADRIATDGEVDTDGRPRDRLARSFGAALRELHETLDPATCPFDRRLDVRLGAAARRIEEGGVDADDFEPEHAGKTPQQLLGELQVTRPDGEDLVVAHGDWCYPNVLFDGERWAVVDVADLGVACRWYDVGIGARSTKHNLGEDAVAAFLDGYGLQPDRGRMHSYLLLDELQ